MFTISSFSFPDLREFLVWIASVLVIITGFWGFRKILLVALEKLHELFIQQNPLNL
jgi:hypothetical protein